MKQQPLALHPRAASVIITLLGRSLNNISFRIIETPQVVNSTRFPENRYSQPPRPHYCNSKMAVLGSKMIEMYKLFSSTPALEQTVSPAMLSAETGASGSSTMADSPLPNDVQSLGTLETSEVVLLLEHIWRRG